MIAGLHLAIRPLYRDVTAAETRSPYNMPLIVLFLPQLEQRYVCKYLS